MTSRRKFIKYTIAGTIAAGAGYSTFKILTPYSKAIASILLEDLKGLLIKTDDIIEFSNQASKQNPWQLDKMQQKILGLYDSSILKKLPLPYKKKYQSWRDQIVGTFLLSTDFFINKMDEKKEIVYSGRIWGPYSTVCMNPFSSLFYKSD